MFKYDMLSGLVEWSLLLVVVEAAQRLVVKHTVVPTVVNPAHQTLNLIP